MPVIVPTYHRRTARQRRFGRAAGLLAGVLAGLLLGAPAAGATTVAAPAGAGTLVVEGAGDGHGVGMSQDGALGYAQHGWSYEEILAHYYTGTTLGQVPGKAVVKVLEGSRVVRVPLERYVRGVVAAEMPAGWPLAALEAQAVASRTYALTDHAGGSRFDVYPDTRSQVYAGVSAETAQTNEAVAATAGQLVLYGGQPAITYFFASSGGMTEDNENSFLGSQPQPWLRSVSDPYDSGAASDWKLDLSFAAASSRLQGVLKGALRGIEVLKRGVSPRIVSAEVLGTGGATQVSGPELAARLGLSSTWAYFSVKVGARVVREPDRSGQAPVSVAPPANAPAPPVGAPGPAPSPTPNPAPPAGPGSQGGAQAPGAAASAKTGGAAA